MDERPPYTRHYRITFISNPIFFKPPLASGKSYVRFFVYIFQRYLCRMRFVPVPPLNPLLVASTNGRNKRDIRHNPDILVEKWRLLPVFVIFNSRSCFSASLFHRTFRTYRGYAILFRYMQRSASG